MSQRILIPSLVAVRYTGEIETILRAKAHKRKLPKIQKNDIVVVDEVLAIFLCKRIEWNRVEEVDLDIRVLIDELNANNISNDDEVSANNISNDDEISNIMALEELLSKMNQINYMDFSEEEQRAVAKHFKVDDKRKHIGNIIPLLLPYLLIG